MSFERYKNQSISLQTEQGKYHQSGSAIENEAAVIDKAKKDPKAFEPLYDKYYVSMFNYFYKRVATEETAADLTSQLFVKVLQQIQSYEHRGVPFSAWLFRIAYSLVNDHYRAKKKRVISVESDEVLDWLADPIVQNTAGDETQKIEWAMKAIKNLKKDQLDLVEMRFFDGLSFKEIGEILGIKENTAKVRCFRITEKLQKEWNKKSKRHD